MFSIFLLLPSLGVDAQKRQMRAMWEQPSVRWAVACIAPKMDDQAGELNGKWGGHSSVIAQVSSVPSPGLSSLLEAHLCLPSLEADAQKKAWGAGRSRNDCREATL